MSAPSLTPWQDRLDALLTKADAAAESRDVPAILAAVEELRIFIAQSPGPAEAAGLDEQAAARARRLLDAAMQPPLDDLAQRSAAHDTAAGSLDRISEGNQRSARSIRLDSLRRAAPVARQVVSVLREVHTAAGGDADATLSRALATAEAVFQAIDHQPGGDDVAASSQDAASK